MSVENVNNLENNQVELDFSITKEVFDAAVTRVFQKNAGKMNVPGFRKGKAPRSIIEKMYGKGVFYEDALNDLIPAAYADALKESGAEAVSQPEFDVLSIDENGVMIKAKFYIKPEAVISEYKGIEVEKIVAPVTEADVDADIARVQNRNSRLIDVIDRPAQNGDSVIIDFDGYVDGEAFEGGKAEKYNLKLGSGSFIPGFEEQIEGHAIGDAFDVHVTFPEEYGSEQLAGKPAVFKVTLHEIKLTELPELDDEFAKDVSEFDTFDEYKADVRAKLEERNDKNADTAVEEKLIDALIAHLEADIPAPMIDSEVENVIRDRDYGLRSQGLDLQTYFKYTGLTLETMREQVRPQAERQVKTRLALEKIVELEEITAEESDLEAEYEKFAKAYNMEVDEIKKSVSADMLANDVKVQKAVKFVKDNAVITVKEPEPAADLSEHSDISDISDIETK